MSLPFPQENGMPTNATEKYRLGGFLNRKERWGLSWKGWVLVLSAALAIAYAMFFQVYPFLAPTHRVDTDVLVVEGWIHEYAILSAVAEFNRGSYQRVFTTGGPVSGHGGYVNDAMTSASVGAGLLRKNGLPDEVLQMAPARFTARDRTYTSALGLRRWFAEHDLEVRGLNVLTEAAHARRTRLLFQQAFGNDVKIGIIAVPNPDYDPTRWWYYSEGVREIIGESLAYIYARLFFHPPKATPIALLRSAYIGKITASAKVEFCHNSNSSLSALRESTKL